VRKAVSTRDKQPLREEKGIREGTYVDPNFTLRAYSGATLDKMGPAKSRPNQNVRF
jgi:hypothetical protein